MSSMLRGFCVGLVVWAGGVFTASVSAQQAASGAQGMSLGERAENVQLTWMEPRAFSDLNGGTIQCLQFEGAVYDPATSWVPFVTERFPLNGAFDTARVQVVNAQYEALTPAERKTMQGNTPSFSAQVDVRSYVTYRKKQASLEVFFQPIRKNPSTGSLEKLVSFEWKVEPFSSGRSTSRSSKRSRSFKVNSVLRSGSWYKMAVTEEGIYRVSYEFLRELGLDVNNLRSEDLRIFGNGGGMLPMANSEERPDDLLEVAVTVEDNGDGRLDPGDYVLFYGQSQHRWEQNGSEYNHRLNYMADSTFYFVTRDYQIGLPRRINALENLNISPTTVVTTYDGYAYHEVDRSNLIKSGRKWYGESFGIQKSYSFPFALPNLITGEPVTLRAAVASRAIGRSSSYTFRSGGNTIFNINFANGVSAGYVNEFALEGSESGQFFPGASAFNIDVTYNNPSSADIGWLDYLELNASCRLAMAGEQLFFRSSEAVGAGIAEYRLASIPQDLTWWDVTDHNNVRRVDFTRSGSEARFRTTTDELREFVAFRSSGFKTPHAVGSVPNQDLHSLPQTDYLIVTSPAFLTQAEQLADFHRSLGEFTVAVVTTKQVYNEFSSGAQDITAIRWILKMMYDRAGMNESQMPKHLLLFGDASYDYKYRISGNSNFVPSYQSVNSTQPTRSYISDDYFGFLDDTESDALISSLDIGIGRFPVRNTTEAQNVVNKIIQYHQLPMNYGPWRNWITFVGDDEDGNIHMRDANRLAQKIEANHPEYNVTKVLFDAYPQEANPGGQRYPGVNEEINTDIDRGTLIMTYVGHGGETGWAHERVLGIGDINKWTNGPRFPLFLTATCEFSRFDDPQRTSGGEFVLLNPDGGGIGLLTTTRLVYSSPNYELSNTFMDHVFNTVQNERPTLGDLLRLSKDVNNINNSNGVNYRNFALLGDPAMKLAYPKYRVVASSVPDTIRALQKVTIRGYVADRFGQPLSDYNGILFPTVFAQPREITTLNNDGTGSYKFESQTSILFRGKASVKNGNFEFSFVVPKDIGFEYGSGRISFYTRNAQADGHGYYEDFVIGGRYANAAEDDRGPDVDLWLNDENFVVGGITDQNPMLVARVFDDNGINTVGNGIGHDIVAILDENTANSIVLNEYYESDLDSYQSGVIRYPFSDLEEGRHTLKMRVWDVHNNSGEATTEFIVAKDENLAVEHILNYPNPFTTRTGFYFDHNAPGQPLDIRIQIFTVSGKLVKTIDADYTTEGYRVGPIYWDGRDEFGDRIGRGVYVYKLKVTAPDGETVEEFEKLVLLN